MDEKLCRKRWATTSTTAQPLGPCNSLPSHLLCQPTQPAPGFGEEHGGLGELPPGAETKARCKVWLEGETPTDSFVWAMTNSKVVSGCVRCEETNSFYVNILFFSCLLTPALSRPSPHLWPARCYLQRLPISLPLLIRFVINLFEQCYSSSCGAGREAAALRCQKSAFCHKISCLRIKS